MNRNFLIPLLCKEGQGEVEVQHSTFFSWHEGFSPFTIGDEAFDSLEMNVRNAPALSLIRK